MKAMIFAAGIGSRLKPFTDSHPKALLPVEGVPMIQRVLSHIGGLNLDLIVVNVHHFASQIIDFLNQHGNFGLPVKISDESEKLLDTGGGLLKARTLLEQDKATPILLHNADILTDVNLAEMMAFHQNSDADVTLLMSHRNSSRMLYFNERKELCGWKNLKTGETIPADLDTNGLTALAFSGVHIVNPSVFPYLEEYSAKYPEGVFSITPFYLANMHNLKIQSYTPNSPFLWHDVGSPEKLASAEAALKAKALNVTIL